MKDKMTPIEQAVVGQHFTDVPDITFRELLDALVNNELPEDCSVWEPFEFWDENFLADHLRNLATAIQERQQ